MNKPKRLWSGLKQVPPKQILTLSILHFGALLFITIPQIGLPGYFYLGYYLVYFVWLAKSTTKKQTTTHYFEESVNIDKRAICIVILLILIDFLINDSSPVSPGIRTLAGFILTVAASDSLRRLLSNINRINQSSSQNKDIFTDA